jgi:hypothetical protein
MVAKPSKGAAVFLFCFGLMFAVPTLLAAYVFIVQKPPKNLLSACIAAIALLVTGSIGAGLIFLAFAGYRGMKKQAAIEEANPNSPWMWKKDWAAMRADSRNKGKELVLWSLSLFVNLIVLAPTVSVLPQLINKMDPRALALLGFDVAGLTLLVFAVRATIRRRRFGNSYFEFFSLPFSPGGRLTGKIHLTLNTDVQHGFNLTLSCLRRTRAGSGEDNNFIETVLWQADQNVPEAGIQLESFGKSVPVDFAIPADAYVTNQDHRYDQVVWRLHADADVPGLSYSDDFEVPVFRSAHASAGAAYTPASAAVGAPPVPAPLFSDSGPVSPPRDSKVVTSQDGGIAEFYFPALRNPGRALVIVLATGLWTVVACALFYSNAPKIFPVVFVLTDLFLIYGSLHVSASSSRVRVGNGEITCIHRTLGIGSTRRFPLSEIAAINAIGSGQQNSGRPATIYAIRLRTKSGKSFTLADEMTSRQEARWIVSQLETLAGMKVDTHVEMAIPFGAPPAPPQPIYGQQTDSGSQARWQSRRARSRTSAALGFVVFASIVVTVLVWQGWHFSTLKSSANSRAHRPRANQAATVNVRKPAAIKPDATPKTMSEEDVERILALPTQQQAEELLERTIGHDPKALEVFEDNVQEWVGHIRLTDRMRQLEQRSRFSKDLRVRWANADINLTLDGWHRNEEAADMLIDRARNDEHYRAAAVYFLGMLAGRGVAYDKIHPILLEYARNNPDATVRQWAVEGMRYLGTDQALDELWESFTQDPSMNVRDRAGCNISDCGNFTRRQRMSMVPKFLELLGSDNLDPQMQSWCFMALHEITDENLPNTAQAWNAWYGQRGAAKLAEFERLNWWEVRGDE